jgi:hypothetical protein
MGQNWRRYASASQSRAGLVSWHYDLFASPSYLRVVGTDLEKIASAFLAVIRGKNGLQDHIIAILTQIMVLGLVWWWSRV